MAEDWVALKNEIYQEIKDIGFLAYFIENTQGAYDITTGTHSNTTTRHPVYVIISQYKQTDNVNILASDFKIKVAIISDFTPELKKNLTLEINSVTYTVQNLTPIMPGGYILLYEVQGRL
jgi:hypothetical protein